MPRLIWFCHVAAQSLNSDCLLSWYFKSELSEGRYYCEPDLETEVYQYSRLHPSYRYLSRDMTKPTNVCAPSVDSDQPGHPPSLIRVFAVRMKKAWVLSYPISVQQRLWSDWADAQADLSLCWTHSHIVGFVMSRFIYLFTPYIETPWKSRHVLCIIEFIILVGANR